MHRTYSAIEKRVLKVPFGSDQAPRKLSDDVPKFVGTYLRGAVILPGLHLTLLADRPKQRIGNLNPIGMYTVTLLQPRGCAP